jgi:RsbT co-antagonist protein rsbRD N-terminal domain
MILLHNLLERNKERIILTLLQKIPREIRSYVRIPRAELKNSLEHLFDAYLELLISKDEAQIRRIFKYVARVRLAQSFTLGTILKAVLSFTPVVRTILQDEFKQMNGDGRQLFNRAMSQIEKTVSDSVATFSEIFQDHIKSKIDEHNQYLNEQNKNLGVDLSRFILFRA